MSLPGPRSRRPAPATVISLIALVFAMGGFAVASIPGPGGVIKGCVRKTTGAARIIDSARRCTSKERTVTWNQQGTPGAQGASGVPGADGAQGPQGQQGPPGSDAQFNGAVAGGELTGSYPNPLVISSIARDKEIMPTVLANDGFGSTLDADLIDSTDIGDLVHRRVGGGVNGLQFTSTFMNTGGTTDYPVSGEFKLTTTGVAGEFKLCNIGAATFNYVAYVNGTRSAATLAKSICTAAFDPGIGGDFQIYARRMAVFGVHSGDGTTNENYQLIGLSVG